VLEVSGIMALTDFFVLVTGSNPRHIKALASELSKIIKRKFQTVPSIEGTDTGWWVLLDAGPVVIHLFEERARKFYELDELWADAKAIDWKP